VERAINLSAAYESAYLIRATEQAIRARYHDDPQPMRTPVHLSIGQETAAVGVAQALNDLASDGWFGYSTHRCHAHYLAMGGDLHAMIAELYGKRGGCAGGWGGSMHLVDESAQFMGTSAIVGSSVSIAVGHALGKQLWANDAITVAWAGDAVPETGQFWEAVNFAALKKLRLLIVIEDNGYATSTPIQQRHGVDLADWFIHASLAAEFVGDRLQDVYWATERIVREDVWPALLNITTQRHYGHVGMGTDEELNYRDEHERLRAAAADPLDELRADTQVIRSLGRLQRGGREARLETVERAIDQSVEAAFRAAEIAPWPDIRA